MRTKRTAQTLSLSTSDLSVFAELEQILKKISVVLFSIFEKFSEKLSPFVSNLDSLQKRRLPGDKRKYVPKLAFVVMIIIIAGIVGFRLKNSLSQTTTDQRIQIQPAKATIALNKEYAYPLKDNTGKEVSKLKYTIESADLRDELIVDGKRAVAVQGRTFLIVTIKLTNEYDKAIEVNARDYIRLSVNEDIQELLAADIHNDPVAVQAISTKYTRIGFPINDTDNKHTLIVGEIKGDKETVVLPFK